MASTVYPAGRELLGGYLPLLSLVTGCVVHRVPDGYGTYGGGQQIFLEARYADQIEAKGRLRPLRVPGGGRRTAQAKAIFYVLHEKCHAAIQTGREYKYPESELEANSYAAAQFRSFCRELGHNMDHTRILWRALPDYYREPEAV